MRELDEGAIEELTGGGECHMHYHPSIPNHNDVVADQAAVKVKEVTDDYVVELNDDIIIGNTNSASLVVTLPPAVGLREYTVVKGASANNLTIVFNGSETCFGQSSIVVVTLGEAKRFKAYLGNWILI